MSSTVSNITKPLTISPVRPLRMAAGKGAREQQRSTATCVYIAGSGRNGSTLLGLHLAKTPDICVAGELTHIWRRSYVNDELCGCGKRFSRCEFWRAVTRTAFGVLPGRELLHILRLRDKVSSFWRIPSLAAGLPLGLRKVEAEYAAIYDALVAAISKIAAARSVVDTSKYPTDLAVLLRNSALPLRVVHLVRDCNAVVFSWKRTRRRPEIYWKSELMPRYAAFTTALGWRLFNAAIERTCAGLGPSYQLLRYEDLVASFPEMLAQIGDWLGSQAATDVIASDYVAHTVSGNPCRFDPPTSEINLDEEWRAGMNLTDRAFVAMLCRGPQRSYGYGKRRFDEREIGRPHVYGSIERRITSIAAARDPDLR